MPYFRLARLIHLALALTILLPGQPIAAVAAPVPIQPPHGPTRPANNPPVANDDNLVAFAGQDFQKLYLLDNDTDADHDLISIQAITVPQHGQFFRNTYDIDYMPDPGFSGVDSFNYTIADGHGGTDTATVTVTVVPAGGTGTASNRFAVYACVPSPAGCDTSFWTVNPNSGATGNTASGACNGAAGLGIQDAYSIVSEIGHAFDTGLTLWINGQQLAPRLPMTVTHYSLVSGPVTPIAGVRVTVHYDGLVGSDTLRTQVIFANVSGATKTFTATLASNLGSNGQTTIVGNSNGNNSFTTTDRWLVTSNSASNPSRLVDTHVLFGPGSPAVTPSAVYTTTFKCSENPANSQGVRADFHLAVPAGKVQRLLFFNQVHTSNAAALTEAAVFNSEPVSLLGGLTNAELTQVVNWSLSQILRLYLPLLER